MKALIFHNIYSIIEYMDKLECMKIFFRVAETQSFSSVAEEFHMTQPMISKRIAWLEEDLSTLLLRRSTRGLSLTSEGQTLYQKGRTLSEELDALFSLIKNEKQRLKGSLRVTASLAFSRIVMAPWLAEFADTHPELKLVFHLSDGYVDLVENNIDLAIRIGSLPDSSLKAVKIGVSERRLYASKSYLKKFGVPRSLDDLHGHRCLYFSRLSSSPSWPLRTAKGLPMQFRFEPYMQADGSDTIREAAISGLGIALMPTWMVEDLPEARELQMILPKYHPEATPIYAVTTFQKELGLKQRSLIEFLQKKLS